MKAIVIGSGVAGLAAAIRLRCQGFEVDVFEANSYPGGKLSEFALQGFRFDAGPSLFTLPKLVDDLFVLAGKNPKEHFSYQQMDVCCHYFYEDGTQLEAYADRQKLCNEIETKLNVPAKVISNYLNRSEETYSLAGEIFLENSLHRWQTWLSSKVMKALTKIHRFGIFNTMNEINEKRLQHPKLVQLFNRYATYNGSNPYQAPGVLTSIPHLEFNKGTYLPKGGMHAITQALYKLAADLGVNFHFNSPVSSIEVEHDRVSGVQVNGQSIASDVVVCNMDAFHAYRKLMPYVKAPEKTLGQERSSSALIFYWGINRTFAELDLHNIFFSTDYQEEFKCIFEKNTVCTDPTVYINITSKYELADAPAGKENWFVMVNVPSDKGQDWNAIIRETKKNVLAKVSRLLKTEIEPLIEVEEILDPIKIESRTSSYQGSLYGTSSNSKFSAFLRHKNFSSNFNNLFFCGGSVHPGGGIPLCLMSAKIVAELVAEQNNGISKNSTPLSS
jgi:phytoene desaturase